MRLTVERLWSSEEQADPWSWRCLLRCRSFMSVIFIKLIMKTVKKILSGLTHLIICLSYITDDCSPTGRLEGYRPGTKAGLASPALPIHRPGTQRNRA